MARLRRVAITCGAAPVRIWERSSSKVTSLTQWSRVSMPQWPCTQAASRVGGAVVGSAKVIRWTPSTVLFPNLVTVLRTGAASAAPELGPRRRGDDLDRAGDPTTMALGCGAADGDVTPRPGLACPVQRGLVALDGEDVVPSGLDDELGGVGLNVHRVHGHHNAPSRSNPASKVRTAGIWLLFAVTELSERDADVVVERGDQMRSGGVAG